MTPRITTLLFDLDGTVLNTVELILESYRHVLDKHLEVDLPLEHFRTKLGTPLWDVFGELTDDSNEVDSLVKAYRAHNREHHDEMVHPYAGVSESIQALVDAGLSIGIVTSKTRVVAERGLQVCGLDHLFPVLIGYEDVENHKPHPAPILRALEALRAEPSTAVYVGDAPTDLQAGQRAGTKTGAALWGPFHREELEPHTPDYWLEHPKEIARFAAR